MAMKPGIRALLAALVVLLAAHGVAEAACSVAERARVALTVPNGSVLVPVMVNDRPATFILDTGAQRSMVTRAAVARLDLALDEWVATTMRGIGGVERFRNALPRSLTLGGVKLERRTRTRDTSLTMGTLPQTRAGRQVIDGLLGRDFLSEFDLSLDLRGRQVTLYQVAGCAGAFLPWTEPYRAVPVENPMESALVVHLELDGVKLRALLDTGASATMVAAPGMARLGLTEQALAGSPTARATGAGPRTVTMVRHRFRTLRIADEVIEAPVLPVAPVRLVPIVDMLLGADWMANKKVWISYATRQVFVAGP
ncbi:MAG: retroviral-like aspartic protease family protein [Acetobacteraceae bacterium]